MEGKIIQKIRPPRFTSQTMELEPYNLKKAICLELLERINLKASNNQPESITELFEFGQYIIIETERRFICV